MIRPMNDPIAHDASGLGLEPLFSYGTLRQEAVQRATFGRVLEGRADSLPGWRLTTLRITDPDVIATSGSAVHPLIALGEDGDETPGMVLWVTADELAAADAYEAPQYRRISVRLRSGAEAWVYVAA